MSAEQEFITERVELRIDGMVTGRLVGQPARELALAAEDPSTPWAMVAL